jgi:transcriptional regulator with XRE-family HTH domain
MSRTSPALPEILREVRKARRMSQLELSMRMGVSQRHTSFVESDRSHPSRELLLACCRNSTLRSPSAMQP